MQALRTREDILKAEQVILRSMCLQLFDRAQQQEIVRVLAGYAWQLGEHQVLFEVVHASKTTSAEKLREQLPAILTRRGFPEVNLASYFAAAAMSAAEALCVARTLAAPTRGEQ